MLVVAGGACGPSVSAIYEGNVRFEHCYRLDLDARVARGHRTACWREWSERYTYGQTRDRLEYAKRRIGALDAGDDSRPTLDLSPRDAGAAPGEAPAPTNLHAPPPPLISTSKPEPPVDAGAPDARKSETADAAPSPPGAECRAGCESTWKTCSSSCDLDAGLRRGGCKLCDTDYGRCVQRCLK